MRVGSCVCWKIAGTYILLSGNFMTFKMFKYWLDFMANF
jgi:hypothetical protein